MIGCSRFSSQVYVRKHDILIMEFWSPCSLQNSTTDLQHVLYHSHKHSHQKERFSANHPGCQCSGNFSSQTWCAESTFTASCWHRKHQNNSCHKQDVPELLTQFWISQKSLPQSTSPETLVISSYLYFKSEPLSLCLIFTEVLSCKDGLEMPQEGIKLLIPMCWKFCHILWPGCRIKISCRCQHWVACKILKSGLTVCKYAVDPTCFLVVETFHVTIPPSEMYFLPFITTTIHLFSEPGQRWWGSCNHGLKGESEPFIYSCDQRVPKMFTGFLTVSSKAAAISFSSRTALVEKW